MPSGISTVQTLWQARAQSYGPMMQYPKLSLRRGGLSRVHHPQVPTVRYLSTP